MRGEPELILDHDSLRLLVLAFLRDHPSGPDEVRATMEVLIARTNCPAPSIDLVIEMLVLLGYVNAAGDLLTLTPTDDGLALLGAGHAVVDGLITQLMGKPELPSRPGDSVPFGPVASIRPVPTTGLAIRDNGWRLLFHVWTGEDRGTIRTLVGTHGGHLSLGGRHECTKTGAILPRLPIGFHTLIVLWYGLGLLGIVWSALTAHDGPRRIAHDPQVPALCIASVVLMSGRECPPKRSELPKHFASGGSMPAASYSH
jgi:hypothetical protein